MEASCVLSKHTIVLPPSLSHLYVFIRRLLHGLFIVTFRSREWIGRCGLVAATKQLGSCGSYESPRQHTDKHNARTHAQKVFCVFLAYCCCNTGHVYEAVVLPRNPPTTLLSFPPSLPLPLSVRLGRSARPQQSLLPGELSLQRWLRKCPGRFSCCPGAAERWPAASRHLLSLHSGTIST